MTLQQRKNQVDSFIEMSSSLVEFYYLQKKEEYSMAVDKTKTYLSQTYNLTEKQMEWLNDMFGRVHFMGMDAYKEGQIGYELWEFIKNFDVDLGYNLAK